MRYQSSTTDQKNSAWFQNDLSKNSLKAIAITEGHLRGLTNATLRFQYPITAIAGRNGSGKSTALALAACAFHNELSGFNPKSRKYPYYTFSDFFIQTKDEVPPDGIKIEYLIASEDWDPGDDGSGGIGEFWVDREKKKGGRWTNY